MKKKWLLWLPVGAAAVWAGSHLLPGLGHNGHMGGFDMHSGRGHGHGMMGFGGKHGFGFDFGWIRTLAGAGVALAGLTLRKYAGETTWKKWAGYGLIAVGLAAVFKPVLPIIAIGAGAYWLFKQLGSSKQEEFSPVGYTSPVTTSNAQALDEWEQNISNSKEDK